MSLNFVILHIKRTTEEIADQYPWEREVDQFLDGKQAIVDILRMSPDEMDPGETDNFVDAEIVGLANYDENKELAYLMGQDPYCYHDKYKNNRKKFDEDFENGSYLMVPYSASEDECEIIKPLWPRNLVNELIDFIPSKKTDKKYSGIEWPKEDRERFTLAMTAALTYLFRYGESGCLPEELSLFHELNGIMDYPPEHRIVIITDATNPDREKHTEIAYHVDFKWYTRDGKACDLKPTHWALAPHFGKELHPENYEDDPAVEKEKKPHGNKKRKKSGKRKRRK